LFGWRGRLPVNDNTSSLITYLWRTLPAPDQAALVAMLFDRSR
jgi:hypothetical protein